MDPASKQDEATDTEGELWLVTGIFAVAASAGLEREAIHNMWLKQPQLYIEVVDDKVDISAK
jgi:hypothetical protein